MKLYFYFKVYLFSLLENLRERTSSTIRNCPYVVFARVVPYLSFFQEDIFNTIQAVFNFNKFSLFM